MQQFGIYDCKLNKFLPGDSVALKFLKLLCLIHPQIRTGTEEDKKVLEKKREEKAKKKQDRKSKKYEDDEDDHDGGEWEKVKGGVPLVKVRHPFQSRDRWVGVTGIDGFLLYLSLPFLKMGSEPISQFLPTGEAKDVC